MQVNPPTQDEVQRAESPRRSQVRPTPQVARSPPDPATQASPQHPQPTHGLRPREALATQSTSAPSLPNARSNDGERQEVVYAVPDKIYAVKLWNKTAHFTQEDLDWLLTDAGNLVAIPEDKRDEAWEALAELDKKASAQMWRRCFDIYVVPRLERSRRLSAERSRRLRESLSRFSATSPDVVQNGRDTPQGSLAAGANRLKTPIVSSTNGGTKHMGVSGEPMVIIPSPARPRTTDKPRARAAARLTQQGDSEERADSVDDLTSSPSNSATLKRKRGRPRKEASEGRPSKVVSAAPDDLSSPKRVRLDANEAREAEGHDNARHPELPKPRGMDAQRSGATSRNRSLSAGNHMDGEDHAHQPSASRMNPSHSDGRKFSIWQGDDYVEDNKENLHEHGSSPVIRSTLEPGDALDAFNSNPPHFTLEDPDHPNDGFRAITDELASSDSNDVEEAPHIRQPVRRTLIADTIDLVTQDEQNGSRQRNVYSIEPSQPSSEHGHLETKYTVAAGHHDTSQSQEHFTDARESPSAETKAGEARTNGHRNHVSLYSDDDEDDERKPYDAKQQSMFVNSSDEGSPAHLNGRFDSDENEDVAQVMRDTQAILDEEPDPNDLMGMPLPAEDSSPEFDPEALMGMPLPADEASEELDAGGDLMGMPLPEDDSSPEPSRQPTPRHMRRRQNGSRQPNHLDTQAILNSDTQIPDFGILPPRSSPPSSPPLDASYSQPTSTKQSIPSSTQPATPNQIEAWVRKQLRRDYDESLIYDSLHKTTMNAPLAELLLDFWAREGEDNLPEDSRGMWTDEDDDTMRKGDARAIKKLEAKHGAQAFNARMDFLSVEDD